ncbi:hypothetical protein PVK06_029070 [Gossypium arboreum]|uniref:Uncharacterized protein n=1 Tax=Gossypium arboreum TaxID=29729 RepID=A0ABR0P5P5_GOSAR|nr:hypothetical protein PVK06_029070 [Gossypium arboreum]
MLTIDPNAALEREFFEYPAIVPVRLTKVNSEVKELFVSQWFDNKKDYVYAIKQYNVRLSVDYKWVQLAVSGCINVDDSNVDNQKIKRASYLYSCTYDARPLKTRCGNNLQLHHVIGKKHVHHSCIGPYYQYANSIQLQEYGNKNVLSVAFAIVESENFKSWEFFLGNLKRGIDMGVVDEYKIVFPGYGNFLGARVHLLSREGFAEVLRS